MNDWPMNGSVSNEWPATAKDKYEKELKRYDDPLTKNFSFSIAREYIAALEAENAGLRSHQACTKRAEAAEAEVERLRAQRCETCATCSQWNHGHGDDGDVVNYCRQLDHAIPRDFYCNRWTAREEGGDE